MKGFKGFNKGLVCNNFQYEQGKEYKIYGEIKLYARGFHFCENPLDVLDCYDLCDSEFGEVECLGKTETNKHKTVTDHIKIVKKIALKEFIKAGINFVKTMCKSDSSQLAASEDSSQLAASGYSSQLAASGDFSQLAASGDFSQLAASGYSSQLAASGDSSQLAASGDSSQLAASGDFSIAAGIGIDNQAKGAKGNWIVLAEWKHDEKIKKWVPVFVKSVQIDGKKIKDDTWYKLENKKFKEVK